MELWAMKETNLPTFLVGTNPEDTKECLTYKSRGWQRGLNV